LSGHRPNDRDGDIGASGSAAAGRGAGGDENGEKRLAHGGGLLRKLRRNGGDYINRAPTRL
jgi:hypothetical protein